MFPWCVQLRPPRAKRSFKDILVPPRHLVGRIQANGRFECLSDRSRWKTEFGLCDRLPFLNLAFGSIRGTFPQCFLTHPAALLETPSYQIVMGKKEIRPNKWRIEFDS